jgi:hypothetical protein
VGADIDWNLDHVIASGKNVNILVLAPRFIEYGWQASARRTLRVGNAAAGKATRKTWR